MSWAPLRVLFTPAPGEASTRACFWPVTLVSVAAVPLLELMLPRLSPTRFMIEGIYKGLYLPLFAACWSVSIRAGQAVSSRSRLRSGVLQSLALVYIWYSEYAFRSGRTVFGIGTQNLPLLALCWLLLVVGYSTLFLLATQAVAKRTQPAAG